ncbi:MAG: hypothetical protein WCT47_03540 [Betaproteobacteria bacterium]|jgi:hypothetical protein
MSLYSAPRLPVVRHQEGLLSVAGLGLLVLDSCGAYLLLKMAHTHSRHARVHLLVPSIAAALPATPQAAQ